MSCERVIVDNLGPDRQKNEWPSFILASFAGLQVTSRRPCWGSRTKAFLSAGKWTLFWCKFSRKVPFVLTTNMVALHMVANQEYLKLHQDLSSLTILPRGSRFPGQSHRLKISYKNLTVNGFTSWYITYFGIIGFLKFNSRVPYFWEDMTPQSLFGRQMPNKDITILVTMAAEMNNVLSQMQTLANRNFQFAKIWLFYIIRSTSRFLLKSPGFETSTSSFMVPRGWEVCIPFSVWDEFR